MTGNVAREAEVFEALDVTIDELGKAQLALPMAAPETLGAYQFIRGLIKAALGGEAGGYLERKEVGFAVGRPAEKCGSAFWCSNDELASFMDSHSARLSEQFERGRILALEIDTTSKRHRYRLCVKSTKDVSFRLARSVLRYNAQVTPPRLNLLGKLKYPGVSSDKVNDYKKWVFLTPYFANLAVVIATLILIWANVALGSYRSITGASQTVILSAFVAYMIWYINRSWHTLLEDKVSVIPNMYLHDDDAGATLERLGDAPTKYIRLRKYTSICPICCDAPVLLWPGAREYPRRIVGRCSESPREHVYSFDRVTLEGRPLQSEARHDMSLLPR